MFKLNERFLSKISEEYELENIEILDSDFISCSLIRQKSKEYIYLFLCKDYFVTSDVDLVLDKISFIDQSFKKGNSYLCVMPKVNSTLDMCTYFNGKSFMHFMFYDNNKSDLVYDKNFYYHGGKKVKKLIDIYRRCFNDWIQNSF